MSEYLLFAVIIGLFVQSLALIAAIVIVARGRTASLREPKKERETPKGSTFGGRMFQEPIGPVKTRQER